MLINEMLGSLSASQIFLRKRKNSHTHLWQA